MLIIDPATGAMWKVVDPVVDETLEKSTTSASNPSSLRIITIDQAPAEVKAKMVAVK